MPHLCKAVGIFTLIHTNGGSLNPPKEKAMISVPKPFEGSANEKFENRRTHHFVICYGGEVRCSQCDCRPSHEAANYPCGVIPPRIIIK